MNLVVKIAVALLDLIGLVLAWDKEKRTAL